MIVVRRSSFVYLSILITDFMTKFRVALIALISLCSISIPAKSLAVEKICSTGLASDLSIDSHLFCEDRSSTKFNSSDLEKTSLPIITAQLDAKTQSIAVTGFRTYRHKNNLFSVSMPSGWKKTDTSKPDEVIVTWEDQTGNAVVSIDIFDNTPDSDIQNNPDSLGKFLTKTVNDIYKKSLKNVVVGEPVDLENGVVRLSWTYESEIGNQNIPMSGTSFIRLDRNRISIFTDIIPTEQFERLKPALDKIVQSFKVNSTIRLPRS
jgi:hypothetical protein